jgi:4-carboxymuconolactone decarboxylase
MTLEEHLEKLILRKKLDDKTIVLCYAAVAGCLNRMKELEIVVKVGLDNKYTTQTEMYEALLQIYLFAGFPAAIESLAVLDVVIADEKTQRIPEDYSPEEFRSRGEILCRSIYTTVYDKMRSRLGNISPELDEWMIIEGYGKTLSRAGLDPKTRELITASSLAALGWENQLYAHIRGAIAMGASNSECLEIPLLLELLCPSECIIKAKKIIKQVI